MSVHVNVVNLVKNVLNLKSGPNQLAIVDVLKRLMLLRHCVIKDFNIGMNRAAVVPVITNQENAVRIKFGAMR